jgi:hypothetical protein
VNFSKILSRYTDLKRINNSDICFYDVLMKSKIIHLTNTYINTYNFSFIIFDSFFRVSDLMSTTTTIKGPLTNQMRLIYPINQSDGYCGSGSEVKSEPSDDTIRTVTYIKCTYLS